MEEVFIISTARTPVGRLGGLLAGFSAIELGAIAIEGALKKANAGAELVQEVFLGNVIPANLGQAPARQTALKAGIGNSIPCTLINKVCASGMKSIMIGAQSIMLGTNDIVVAGGMESMSNIPYYIPKARFGYKYGHGELIDGLQKDGLWEAYHQFAMGNCADHTARDMNISREEQDTYAIESYQRAIKATKNGFLKKEIVPVEIPQRKGDALVMDEDEEINYVNFDKIPQLRPVFSKEGTVTAANASTINDGASAVVLANKKAVEEHNLKPIARILGFADAAQEPIWFTTSPALAIPRALQMAKVDQDEVDYYEINEAFSVVVIANNKLLDLDPDKVNIYGGAVSIGHPIGCSGARITGTLANILRENEGKIGVAGICNGGGGASAIVIEKY
jgi:acetyl-CoA C-acetyltransferase